MTFQKGNSFGKSNAGKIREKLAGENNCNWKGENANYRCKHSWVERHKGKAKKCSICKNETAKRYEWANIDHQYKRNLDDYIEMCSSCHKRYDYSNLRKIFIHSCELCSKEFTSIIKSVRFCSLYCNNKSLKIRRLPITNQPTQ